MGLLSQAVKCISFFFTLTVLLYSFPIACTGQSVEPITTDAGDKKAVLGFHYQLGYLADKDEQKASRLFWDAAHQKSTLGIYGVADMVSQGKGGNQINTEKTDLLFKKIRPLLTDSALQGDMYAQAALGRIYQVGQGVEKDYAMAAKWYRMASEQGYAPAQFCIGYMYAHGLGMRKNNSIAIDWLNMAASNGYSDAKGELNALRHDDSTIQSYSGTGLAKHNDIWDYGKVEARVFAEYFSATSSDWIDDSSTHISGQVIFWLLDNMGIGIEAGLQQKYDIAHKREGDFILQSYGSRHHYIDDEGSIKVIPLGAKLLYDISLREKTIIRLEGGLKYLKVDADITRTYNLHRTQTYQYWTPYGGYTYHTYYAGQQSFSNEADVDNAAVLHLGAEAVHNFGERWSIYAGIGYQLTLIKAKVEGDYPDGIWGDINDEIDFDAILFRVGLSKSF